MVHHGATVDNRCNGSDRGAPRWTLVKDQWATMGATVGMRRLEAVMHCRWLVCLENMSCPAPRFKVGHARAYSREAARRLHAARPKMIVASWAPGPCRSFVFGPRPYAQHLLLRRVTAASWSASWGRAPVVHLVRLSEVSGVSEGGERVHNLRVPIASKIFGPKGR